MTWHMLWWLLIPVWVALWWSWFRFVTDWSLKMDELGRTSPWRESVYMGLVIPEVAILFIVGASLFVAGLAPTW